MAGQLHAPTECLFSPLLCSDFNKSPAPARPQVASQCHLSPPDRPLNVAAVLPRGEPSPVPPSCRSPRELPQCCIFRNMTAASYFAIFETWIFQQNRSLFTPLPVPDTQKQVKWIKGAPPFSLPGFCLLPAPARAGELRTAQRALPFTSPVHVTFFFQSETELLCSTCQIL